MSAHSDRPAGPDDRVGSDDPRQVSPSAKLPTAEILAAMDPAHPERLDPTVVVYEPDAFPAFITADDHARVRQVLGASLSQRRAGSGMDRRFAALPVMWCGEALPDGRRCGWPIRAVTGPRGVQMRYANGVCAPERNGHYAVHSPVIEQPIIDAICAAYDPSALESVIRRVRLHAAGDRRALTRLDAECRELEAKAQSICALEVEAYQQQHTIDRQRWARARHEVEARLEKLARQRAEAERTVQGVGPDGSVEEQVTRLRALAADLPRLFREAKDQPYVVATLIGLLTKRVFLSHPAPYFALAEIEFRSGASVQVLIVTGSLPSIQPERAFAYAELSRGVAPKVIADRIVQVAGRHDPLGRTARRLFRPVDVLSLGLAYRYFEQVEPRHLTGERPEDLAARVHIEVDEAWYHVLAGHFGPARIDGDGQVRVAPSAAELERHCAEYARVQVARRAKWPLDDVALFRDVAHERGMTVEALIRAVPAVERRRRVQDRAGRRYVRLSQLPAAVFQLPKADLATSRRRFEEQRERLVVTAGWSRDMAADFHSIPETLAHFRRRFRTLSPASLFLARQTGRVASLPYQGPSAVPGRPRPRVLLHCPPEVWNARKWELVSAWLNGRLDSVRRTRRSSPRPSRGTARGDQPSPQTSRRRPPRGGDTRSQE